MKNTLLASESSSSEGVQQRTRSWAGQQLIRFGGVAAGMVALFGAPAPAAAEPQKSQDPCDMEGKVKCAVSNGKGREGVAPTATVPPSTSSFSLEDCNRLGIPPLLMDPRDAGSDARPILFNCKAGVDGVLQGTSKMSNVRLPAPTKTATARVKEVDYGTPANPPSASTPALTDEKPELQPPSPVPAPEPSSMEPGAAGRVRGLVIIKEDDDLLRRRFDLQQAVYELGIRTLQLAGYKITLGQHLSFIRIQELLDSPPDKAPTIVGGNPLDPQRALEIERQVFELDKRLSTAATDAEIADLNKAITQIGNEMIQSISEQNVQSAKFILSSPNLSLYPAPVLERLREIEHKVVQTVYTPHIFGEVMKDQELLAQLRGNPFSIVE